MGITTRIATIIKTNNTVTTKNTKAAGIMIIIKAKITGMGTTIVTTITTVGMDKVIGITEIILAGMDIEAGKTDMGMDMAEITIAMSMAIGMTETRIGMVGTGVGMSVAISIIEAMLTDTGTGAGKMDLGMDTAEIMIGPEGADTRVTIITAGMAISTVIINGAINQKMPMKIDNRKVSLLTVRFNIRRLFACSIPTFLLR